MAVRIRVLSEEETLQLRAEYFSIDKSDRETQKAWFLANTDLSIWQLCVILKATHRKVRLLQRRCGCGRVKQVNLLANSPKKRHRKIDLPNGWQENKEFLESNLKLYGINHFSKIASIRYNVIRDLADKFGIEYTHKHPCCNKDWCFERYVERRWDLERCAQAAGITKTTFMSWLLKFELDLRDSDGYVQPKWVLDFIKKLRTYKKVIKKVNLCDNTIIIEYKIGSKEVYTYTESEQQARIRVPGGNYPLLPKNCVINDIPRIQYQYGHDIETRPICPAHLIVRNVDLRKTTTIERQLTIRFFVQTLAKRRYQWPKHPVDEVIKDFERLRSVKISDYIVNKKGEFVLEKNRSPTRADRAPGAKVVDHFSYMKHCFRHWKVPKLIAACKQALEKHKNSSELVYSMVLRDYWSRNRINPFRSPGYYVSLFKYLGVSGKILDVFPGVKMYACAAMGLHYHTAQIIRWERCRQNSNHWFVHEAIKHGFSDLFEFQHTAWAGDEVDWIIYDRFTRPRFDLIEEYLRYTKNLIVFVPNVYYETIYDSIKPRMTIPTYIGGALYGHYFVW